MVQERQMVKFPAPTYQGAKCLGVKRPGPKSAGAKRPVPKSRGAKRPDPK